MPSSRRQLLVSLGAGLAGIAGCSTAPSDGTTPSEPSETPTPTQTAEPATLGDAVTVDGTAVTVSNLVSTHSFLYLSAPDAFGVEVADGQFAFVTVEAGDDPPEPDAFAFAFDGERRPATTYHDYGPAGALPVAEREYSTDDPQGYLGFELPAPLAAESVAVSLGDARWTIPASARTPLQSPPPSFTVEYDVPDAVASDAPVPVTLAVTNEGDGDGTFRGAINHQGPMYGAGDFAFSLAAGESRTYEESIDYHQQQGFSSDRLQFAVVSSAGERTFEVRLESAATTGTATSTATTGTATSTLTSSG
jgi:hypothetical protein